MSSELDRTIPDLTGRRAVVTGASDGVGLELAVRLAGAGAEVVLPVRNRTKGQAALERIHGVHPRAVVSLRDLDLSSLESVAHLGAGLREEGVPIAYLVNNAGLMHPPQRRVTVDGFELQLGTNHLGHAALVGHLLPLLVEGGARVTSQVSVAAARGEIPWDDLNAERRYDAMAAYRASKIALGLFGLELDRRSRAEGWGILSNLSHPGVVPTGLLSARPEMGRERDTLGVRVIRAMSSIGFVGTPATACLPALYAATSPDAEGGRLYGPGGFQHLRGAPAEQPLYRPLRDPAAAERVWRVTEELTGVALAV